MVPDGATKKDVVRIDKMVLENREVLGRNKSNMA
jgi:hypothetical protein